jgi:hypothetical protein
MKGFIYIILISLGCILSCTSFSNEHSEQRAPESAFSYKEKNNINQSTNHTYDRLLTDGVVRIKTDVLEQMEDTVYIQSESGNTMGFITGSNNEAPSVRGLYDIKIRSYDPDYYIIIFDGYAMNNNRYRVFLNHEWVYIVGNDKVVRFEKWQDHLINSYVVTNENNPLRKNHGEDSPKIDCDYFSTHFICEKVLGEWIYVNCNIDCEGCPGNEIKSGWIRWKRDNNLLISLRYSC